ncbi:helix-turn-helix transcriptional regulator [Synechococcus sp. MIT S1220]|uniref:helix-turn-helix transcriptional regulator n=1 Tax=Synechococcus sp. MIT S1220 TaxID=3082549 RepID=UPI0039AF6312
MQLLDATVRSCADLQELFKPISSDLAALQLSNGPLDGRLRIYSLGAFRLTLLEINQSLFISGTRRPKPCTLALDLGNTTELGETRAQGIQMPWKGLMGYNFQLRDFDLQLPAHCKVATLIISKDHLLERLTRRRQSNLILERWEKTNQLELQEPSGSVFQQQLHAFVNAPNQDTSPDAADCLITALLDCFDNQNAETRPIAKRQIRHQAAIELLHWCQQNPQQSMTIDEMSQVLFQSRTSLFKGCQEHFGRTPLELQRSIRLDLVRQLLLNPERCQRLELEGVGAIAAKLGFQSRSHFARRYEQRYGELPQDTLHQNRSRDHNAGPS